MEAVDHGATEVCLQGGIHPDFDGDYYLEVTRAVKEAAPDVHVHAFTALEVTEGAHRLDVPLPDYLATLRAAGLSTLPGTAAEILDDEVRAIICPDKVNTDEWLDAHRSAHRVGLRSNVTIMFGHVERPVHVARHFVRTRALQAETGGFTEFVPLPFVHMAAPLYLQGRARQGPTFREVLLVHAVGRIAYRGSIDNVQASWVKVGVRGARQLLAAGCNDLGGTLMDENISRATWRGARPGARRRRVRVDRGAARAAAGAAHHPVRAHPDGRAAVAAGAGRRGPGCARGPQRVVSGSPSRVEALDVLGVGNALVDVLSPTADDFLDGHGLVKGSMALLDAEQAAVLYEEMGPATEASGGSAANTVVGVASLGGASAFIGRVRDDTLGAVFADDLRAAGVHFDTTPATDGQPTGRCLILVTPDAERTLNTFLGAAAELHADDVSPSLVEAATVTYLEGYLFDQPDAKEAFRHAAATAHRVGRQVALSLSDTFCVERHRPDFLALVEHGVDLLFGNDTELCALYQVDRLDDALDLVRRHCQLAAVTLGAAGSLVVSQEETMSVPVHPVPGGVVDTTGAGDLYAAGFLYGVTHGRTPFECGALGALAASEVISHLGARPERSLAELAASVGS